MPPPILEVHSVWDHNDQFLNLIAQDQGIKGSLNPGAGHVGYRHFVAPQEIANRIKSRWAVTIAGREIDPKTHDSIQRGAEGC